MEAINSAIVLLNQWGRAYCDLAGPMFLQSSLLVGLLLMADRCLRARVSARFRYGMWLLVPVKLVLPPTLALPTGLAYWLGRCWPAASIGSEGPIAILSGAVGKYAGPFEEIAALPAMATEAAAVRSHIGSLQWPALVLLGWAVGVLLLLALVLWQIVSVRRSLSRSRPAGPRLVALLEECRAELKITTRVGLRLTDDVRSPAVSGSWRPVILLPAGLPSGLSPQGLRTIFTHELAHIKRWDLWVNLAQTALQVAYFWHPLVWVTNRRLRHLRELAVDETVLVALRSQAQCYADTLIDIAEMAFRKPAFNLRWMGIAESKRTLERRIAHMLNPHLSRRSALGLSGLLTILVLGAVLVPMGRAQVAAQATRGVVQSAPALPPGIAELFHLSKDAVLEKLGKPARIVWQDKTYTLENLPEAYDLVYEGLSLRLREGTVSEVMLSSPKYVFGNGIHVGDTEAKVKQAFGADCELREDESDPEDLLVYECPGLCFQISKQDRSVRGIYIVSDYGVGGRAQAYVGAGTFAALLPQRIATFNIDSADLKQVLATFGPPVKYAGESNKSFSPDQLPKQFMMVYPCGFHVIMSEDHVVELQHEEGSTYVFAGKLHYGSTLEEALAVLGPPVKTVQGQPIDWANSANVLFRDIDGRKGRDYYRRPDLKVRVLFANDKVAGIYLTRSDYGNKQAEPSEPFDAEFARLLQERVAKLNIDTAGQKDVVGIFGPPRRYVWGEQTFQPDALPATYWMFYPDGFSVWLSKGRINEIRHMRPSPYVYRGKLRIGSTLQETVDLLGAPDKTVTGEKATAVLDDRVLYRDLNGQRGYDYYRRTDQNVVIFFREDKVSAIFMTRSDPDFFMKRAGAPKADRPSTDRKE
jgi:beta-lactamase regulating signal transducer with metallopeptidase domain